MCADERCEGRHGATLGATEDRTDRRSLLIDRTLVDVGGKGPVAVTHRAWGMGDYDDIKPVERHLTITTLIDVERQSHVASALRGSGGQRCGRRDKARAH